MIFIICTIFMIFMIFVIVILFNIFNIFMLFMLIMIFNELSRQRELGRHIMSFWGQMARLLGREEKTDYGLTVWPQKDGREKTYGPAPFGARKVVFSLGKGFHSKARENRPDTPPLNIDIIPWRHLSRTVLIFQVGSHSRVQSSMPVLDTVTDPVMHMGEEVILTPPTLT